MECEVQIWYLAKSMNYERDCRICVTSTSKDKVSPWKTKARCRFLETQVNSVYTMITDEIDAGFDLHLGKALLAHFNYPRSNIHLNLWILKDKRRQKGRSTKLELTWVTLGTEVMTRTIWGVYRFSRPHPWNSAWAGLKADGAQQSALPGSAADVILQGDPGRGSRTADLQTGKHRNFTHLFQTNLVNSFSEFLHCWILWA